MPQRYIGHSWWTQAPKYKANGLTGYETKGASKKGVPLVSYVTLSGRVNRNSLFKQKGAGG